MRALLRPLLLALLALCACRPDQGEFTPVSLIEHLRILDIKAEPAELVPGQTTHLTALVVDPPEVPLGYTLVWVVCDPAPDGGTSSPCAQMASARDAATFVSDPPPGVHFMPAVETTPYVSYTAPRGVFDDIAPGTLARRRGLTATVLLVAFKGWDVQNLQDPQARKEFAIKRIHIADPEADPNAERQQNPRIDAVRLDGEPVSNDAGPLPVRPGAQVEFSALAADGSQQQFQELLGDGRTQDATEQAVFSWFTTGGSFSSLLGRTSRTSGADPIQLQLPMDSDDGFVDVYVVLRDARGGSDWTRRRLQLAR